MIAVIFKGRESLFSRPFVSPSPLTTNCKRVIHAAGGGTPKDAHSPPPEGRRGGAQGRAQGRAQGWGRRGGLSRTGRPTQKAAPSAPPERGFSRESPHPCTPNASDHHER